MITEGRKPLLRTGSDAMVSVRSTSCSASRYALIEPPPQLKKMSGAFGEPIAVRSFAGYAEPGTFSSLILPLAFFAAAEESNRSIAATWTSAASSPYTNAVRVPPPPGPPEEPQAVSPAVPAAASVVAPAPSTQRLLNARPPLDVVDSMTLTLAIFRVKFRMFREGRAEQRRRQGVARGLRSRHEAWEVRGNAERDARGDRP
ncbi:hypothetical protein E2C11_24785 [Streptomyces lavendulae]|nr:hypothetical protein E2C11_24785 [Streptomyces lavendulae]